MDQSIDVVVDVCVGMVTMVSVSSVSMARMIERWIMMIVVDLTDVSRSTLLRVSNWTRGHLFAFTERQLLRGGLHGVAMNVKGIAQTVSFHCLIDFDSDGRRDIRIDENILNRIVEFKTRDIVTIVGLILRRHVCLESRRRLSVRSAHRWHLRHSSWITIHA